MKGFLQSTWRSLGLRKHEAAELCVVFIIAVCDKFLPQELLALKTVQAVFPEGKANSIAA
jgi:hypothetical protein